MEAFSVIFSIILLVFGILQIILFFKMWGMCNDVAEMKERFKAICPTEYEKKSVELYEKQQKVFQHKTNPVVNNNSDFQVGDNVIYEPMNRKMIIKEITNDGKFVCISYKKDGSEEYEGTYKPEQIKLL